MLRGKMPWEGILLRVKERKSVEKPRLRPKLDPSQEPILSPAWPPRKECRVRSTPAAGRRSLGTGHDRARAWPRPWFSNSLFDGRKCTAMTSTGWQSRGLQNTKGQVFFSTLYLGNCTILRATLELNSWGGMTAWGKPEPPPPNTLIQVFFLNC